MSPAERIVDNGTRGENSGYWYKGKEYWTMVQGERIGDNGNMGENSGH